MKKILVSVLLAVFLLMTVSTSFAETSRSYSISNLSQGSPLWSKYSIPKATSDRYGYVTCNSITSGTAFDCRLYKSDKSTQAMSNYMSINSSPSYDCDSITKDPTQAYSVYMKFTNGGTTSVAASGRWGVRVSSM